MQSLRSSEKIRKAVQEEAHSKFPFHSLPHAKVQRHPLYALAKPQAALHGEEIENGWGAAFYVQGAPIAGYGRVRSLLRAKCRS